MHYFYLSKDVDLRNMFWHSIHKKDVGFLHLVLPEACEKLWSYSRIFFVFILWKPHFMEKPGFGSPKLLI